MWDLPGPGLEPVSPALAGGFLTTVPPGRPWLIILNPYYELFYPTSSSNLHMIKGFSWLSGQVLGWRVPADTSFYSLSYLGLIHIVNHLQVRALLAGHLLSLQL